MSSNSHKAIGNLLEAIGNLLEAVADRARAEGQRCRVVKKTSDDGYDDGHAGITPVDEARGTGG